MTILMMRMMMMIVMAVVIVSVMNLLKPEHLIVDI